MASCQPTSLLPGQGVRHSVKCNMTREMSREISREMYPTFISWNVKKCKIHFTAHEILFTRYIKQSPSRQVSRQASRGAGKQAGKQEAGEKASKASEQVSRQGSSQAQKHLEGIQSEPCPGGACLCPKWSVFCFIVMKRSFKSEQRAWCCIRPRILIEDSRASTISLRHSRRDYVIMLDVIYI